MTTDDGQMNVSPYVRAQAQANLGAVLIAIGDAVLVTDAVGRVTLLNPVAERLTGWTTAEATGIDSKVVFDIVNEATRQVVESPVDRVMRDGVVVGLANHTILRRRDGTDLYIDDSGAPVRDEAGNLSGVVLVFRDISERRVAEAALRASDEKLRDAHARLDSALSAGKIGTWTWDIPRNRVVADKNFARFYSVSPQDADGGPREAYLEAIHPDDRARVAAAIGRTMGSTDQYESEYRVVMPDGSYRWLEARGSVERDGHNSPQMIRGVVVDITERVERERRERFLADLTARVRALLDPDEVLYETAKAVGEYTGAHRCLYIEIDDARGKLTIRRDFVQDGIPSMAGTHSLAAFGARIVDSLRAGNVTQVDDTELDSRLTEDDRATFRAVRVRAFLAVPLHTAGNWVAVLALQFARPRTWTRPEFELLNIVGARTWLAVENAHLFRETRRRAEREALLNKIGTAVRGTLSANEILTATVTTLGQGIRADRCYFVRYSQTRDIARVFPEWLRDGANIVSIASGPLQMSSFSVDRDPIYKAGRTHVVDDIVAFAPGESATLQAVDIRALLRVPIEVGDEMTALAVSMAFEPRHWTDDEIQLVESVATLLHSVLELALVQQRERNISRQLQDALQPPIPPGLPGLALASYYRPALAEARVGGDFYDVFSLDDTCHALVVADLSGKGLAAASQVSTVRNMLRYALYGRVTIAEAVTRLHRNLLKHELLTGFATLFVGVYNDRENTLTYVNCGQDPALIVRQGTGTVIQMAPTGPVLGGFGEGDFEERVVPLTGGDVVAIFTDGLTEVGPTRKNLLEVQGVIDVLRACCAESSRTVGAICDPQSIVNSLIAGVDEFAGGGARDDIALLVAVVDKRDGAMAVRRQQAVIEEMVRH